jgi:conserved domain protein
MCRYRPRDLQRRYWLGALVALVLFAALFYGFFADTQLIASFLQESCAFLPGDEADTDTFEMQWDAWFANREAVLAALQHLFFWSLALLWLTIFYLRWNYSLMLRALLDPPDGRQFVLSVSAEGLLMEEAGRTRLFYFWPAVSRVILDAEFLLFYVNRNIAWFIPLDRFADQAAAESFFQQALAFKEHSQ